MALMALSLTALVAGALSTAAATNETDTRKRLEALKGAIDRIAAAQRKDEAARDALQVALRTAETDLASLAVRVREIAQRSEELVAQLEQLSKEKASLLRQRDAQRSRIAAELRRAWVSGGDRSLKLLLNQEEPEALARVLAYYRYLTAARSEAVANFRRTLEELAAIEASATAKRLELEGERQDLSTQEAKLAAARDRRQQALVALAANIEERDTELARLTRDAQALEDILSDIQVALRDIAIPDSYQPFSAARGRMPWPAEGEHGNRFGRPRNQGKMRWQGITINGEAGSTVRAIHQGRVVYADWLRGSGLLMVLDHGEGYMSLYAHNQSLLKDVGDWVSTGTPVATVGASGGREQAALYFEIRENGKPVDPAHWCGG